MRAPQGYTYEDAGLKNYKGMQTIYNLWIFVKFWGFSFFHGFKTFIWDTLS